MSERLIFHIDVNSAFLSWEAAKRVSMGLPDLRLVPSIIGGDPDSRRSIVSAKSIPAKKYGINTGEPVSMALRKCPELIVAPPDFELYHRCSSAFIEICRSYAPVLEQASIDECYLDMTGTGIIYPNPVKTAHEIKDRIKNDLGFTVNVGIGNNKLLAKMASDFEKPDKVHTLYRSEIQAKMWPLPVGELFLCGKSSAARLKSARINTIGDLAKADISYIKSIIGNKGGTMLYCFANGIDDSEVSNEYEDAKSYGMSTTLEENVTSYDSGDQIILMLSDHVARRIRRDAVRAGCVAVTIRDTDFRNRSHQKHFPEPTDITSEIYKASTSLLREIWDGRTPLRLLNVTLSDMSAEDAPVQLSLFTDESREKSRKADRATDMIRDRFGSGAIKRGSELLPKGKNIRKK